ncbi:MAG: hypothetical protein AAFX79_13115 [Planctomycetota bacterium]
MTRTITIASTLAVAAPLAAQDDYRLYFEIDDPTLRPGESTAVTLWATWTDYALAYVGGDVEVSTGLDGLTDLSIVPPYDGPGTLAGDPTDAGIEGYLVGQLNFPPAGWTPPPAPGAYLSWTYTAPDDVPAAFDVDLRTATTRFDVYLDRSDPVGASRLDLLEEASATIRVVPAPTPLVVIGAAVLAVRRRR